MTLYLWETRREAWGTHVGSDEWTRPSVSTSLNGVRALGPSTKAGLRAMGFTSPQLAWYAAVEYWYGHGRSRVARELRVVEVDGTTHEVIRVVAEARLTGFDGDLAYPVVEAREGTAARNLALALAALGALVLLALLFLYAAG